MTQPSLPANAVVHRDLRYAQDHPRQALDLYLPFGTGPWPLIVWVHGGAFMSGSKEGPLPVEYVAKGFAIASINYRLSQHAIWPAQIIDCKAAVRWLRAHAAAYGIDPACVAAFGPSAGGHLVAMLGVSAHVRAWDQGENLDQSSAVQAVVDCFGPTDFSQMDAHRIPEGQVHDGADSPESRLIGGALQENPECVAAANPIPYVMAGAPPFLIIHGERDPLVPHHQSLLLKAALEKANVPVQFYTVPGGVHGGFVDPHVDELTEAFLQAFAQGNLARGTFSGQSS